MSKSLIIAEKPSVANDLARALGGFKKQDDHFENDQYVISSALGHLVELCLPEELDVKRGKWTFRQACRSFLTNFISSRSTKPSHGIRCSSV